MGWVRNTLIVFVIIVLVIILAGVYFYQLYSFKTLRICVSPDARDTLVPCSVGAECVSMFASELPELQNILESDLPLIKESSHEILSAAISCEGTCKIREIRGLEERGEIDACDENDKEFVFEITGKEGLEILKSVGNVIR